MRVVGGQCRFGKRLGAFVTDVDADGPADSYGILEGERFNMVLPDNVFSKHARLLITFS